MTQKLRARKWQEFPEWWQAVQAIATMVSRDGVAPDAECFIRQELRDQGYSSDGIGKAMDWVGMVALSGHLLDTLSMLQPESAQSRVVHPLELASLSPETRRAVEICRYKGILTPGASERLIEGLRALDARDWDVEEVEVFFSEILGYLAPALAGKPVARVLWGRSKTDLH